jgi:hypothetical protein
VNDFRSRFAFNHPPEPVNHRPVFTFKPPFTNAKPMTVNRQIWIEVIKQDKQYVITTITAKAKLNANVNF